MKRRIVEINCEAAIAKELSRALRAYANAAYPPGGSECGQVARSTLLDTAVTCEQQAGDALRLRKRQLPILRAAVRWWLSEKTDLCVESARGLEQILAAPTKSA
jgi:hypothetical protein